MEAKDYEEIVKQYQAGATVNALATAWGVTSSCIYRILKRYDVRLRKSLNTDLETWGLCNDILNMLRREKGLPIRPKSENPYVKSP